MENIFEKCKFISSAIERDLIIYKNPVDDKVNVFVFVELNNKTANTPYHEFIGKDITDELSILNTETFSPNSFDLRLDKKLTIIIKSSENNWIWMRANKAE